MAIMKTFLPTNLARIICPIFGAEVELRSCLMLRDKMWKGQAEPVRQGCQACMRASKCPIVPMVSEITRTNVDAYYSAEPRVVRLASSLLRKIAAVVVPDQIVRMFTIQPRQLELIRETNGLSGSSKLRTGGVNLGEINVALPSEGHRDPAPRKSSKPAPTPEDVSTAAATGDMSAVVNAMMKESAASAA